MNITHILEAKIEYLEHEILARTSKDPVFFKAYTFGLNDEEQEAKWASEVIEYKKKIDKLKQQIKEIEAGE